MQAINLKLFVTTLFVWAVTVVAAQNIRVFQAKPDMPTKALQSLIDKASAKGGGQITFAPGKYYIGTLELKKQDVPEQIQKYPEFTMFGELPAWGLYLRHIRNITLKNVHLSLAKDDFRPEMVCEDVEGLAR